MKTSQRLTWVDKATNESKTWLMLPNEVAEFLEISARVSPDYAFERLTGLTAHDKALITLKVNYHLPAQPSKTWNCSHCGETNGNEAGCWNCGSGDAFSESEIGVDP